MGTRIQDKSRPTKRPQATVGLDGTPGWDKVRSGKPKIDKKGFPATDGIPYPVTVTGSVSYPAPSPGTTRIGGTWSLQSFASSDDGSLALDTLGGSGDLTIADSDLQGTDVSATIAALAPADVIWIGTPFGTWEADVDTVTPGSGVTIIVFSNAAKSSGFGYGQSAHLAATT